MDILSVKEIAMLASCGAGGALVKDLVVDNCLQLPKISAGKIALGFLGSMIIGAAVGYIVDNSPITAFFAGFAGFATLEALMPKKFEKIKKTETELPVGPIPQIKKTDFRIQKPFCGDFLVTQKFGENPEWYKVSGYAGHFGIDFATPWGTPVLACDDGIVCRTGYTSGNGYFIELQHSWGKSLYLHFWKGSTVKLSLMAKRGHTIGFSGNTGSVRPAPTPSNPKAGSHLHFSIKINGVANMPYKDFIDPVPYFADKIWGVS